MLWHRAIAGMAYHPVAMRASFLLAEACVVVLICWLLRRRELPSQRLLIYLWNPLAILQIARCQSMVSGG